MRRLARERLANTIDWLAERPRPALATIIATQLVLTFALSRSVHRNGWLYYQGGDQIWYSTTGWLSAHGELPYTFVGYGWSLLLAPIMALTGPDFVSALPPTILIEVLVLAPLLTLCVYCLAAEIGGRLVGLWSAALWVVIPFAAIPLFVHRYHSTYVEQVLPQALGLTEMADFPSTVAIAIAGVLVLRSLRRGALNEALLAGVIVGFAAGMKPSNYLFAAGPALAYPLARRWREGAAFALALGPASVVLVVWKLRGLGELPVFALGETRVAAGAVFPVASWWNHIPLDWHQFAKNMDWLREFFFSNRVVQWAPLAGALAVARRSPPAAGLLLGWLLSYVVVKGTTPVASIERGDFWRLVMPALPAFVVLVAFVPLLVPGLYRKLATRPLPRPRAVGIRPVVVAAILLAGVPLAVASLSHKQLDARRAVIVDDILTPVDSGEIAVHVARRGASQRLTWEDKTPAHHAFYRIYRTQGTNPDFICGRAGSGAFRCQLNMIVLETTRSRSYVDRSPEPGVTYRVAVAANWIDDTEGGDVFLISGPVRAAA